MVPYWLKKYLAKENVASIERTIEKMERTTQAEIVPMIVRSSSYDRKEMYLFYLIFLLAAFLTNNFLFILGVVGVFFLNKYFKRHHVLHRAQAEFNNLGITHTKNDTGVLLFISLQEKKVVILADEKISDFINPVQWEAILDKLTSSIKKGSLGYGIEVAIEEIATLCAPYAPPVDDINELSNHLVMKE